MIFSILNVIISFNAFKTMNAIKRMMHSIESVNCERPHTVLIHGWIQDFQIGVQKIMHTLHTSQVRNTKSLMARSRVLDVLLCYLSLILKHSDTKRNTNKKSPPIINSSSSFFFFFFFFFGGGGGGGAWIRHWSLQVY